MVLATHVATHNWPYRISTLARVAASPAAPTEIENEVLVRFGTPESGWRLDRPGGDFTIMLSRVYGTIGIDPAQRDYSFLTEWDEPDA